ncbi:MAG: CotH kinase family protein [Bacteroidota bacterium]
MYKLLLISVTLLFSLVSTAQVKINEYSASNSGSSILDNTGEKSDWIELYNSGPSVVNIGGWRISDDLSDVFKYSVPSGITIPSNSVLRVWCSGKGGSADAPGHLHTNFKLTQCNSEWIILTNGSAIIDSIGLRRTQATHSMGRKPDGSSTWNVFTSPTPNTLNSTTGFSSYAPTPKMDVAPGFYSGTKLVSLSSTPSNGISIYYTTDGSVPLTSSTQYVSTPVSISVTSVLRAYAVSSDPDILPSFMETNTYFINETIDSHYGVVSVSGGAPLNQLFGGFQNKPATHFEYFENQTFKTEGYGTADKHGQDSWAYEQRGIDIETFDEYGYNNAFKHQFFTDPKMNDVSSRKEFQHIMIKAAASDNYSLANDENSADQSPKYPAHMRDAFVQSYAFQKGFDLDGRRNKHVIVFKNGTYWGIYELREAFEADYTDYYYDQPADSIDNLAYWGGLDMRNGSDTGWVNLYNFIMGNSMTNVANYAYVESKLNFKSLVDYMIYNSYVVNSDFINYNSAWWRGRAVKGDKKKWRYWMWDMDNVYGLGENYSNISTTQMDASPCDYSNAFQNAGPNEGHPDILEKLLTNPDFKSFYINRYADLINSALKCDKILPHFNYFKTILSAEMPRHIAKWGDGTFNLARWNSNMDTLELKIQQRCSFIDSVIVDCYNVSGPYQITVDVDPPGAGNVKLNSIWLNNFTWTGNYFGGVKMNFQETVLDTALYEFDHWEFKNHTPSPSITNDSVAIQLTTSENVIAHYNEKTKEVVFPTAFTPNGDGRNDILEPLGIRNVKSMTIEIWNRWGEQVFSSSDAAKGWDGNYKGTPAQTGVYAYLVKYMKSDGEEKIIKGNITLIR